MIKSLLYTICSVFMFVLIAQRASGSNVEWNRMKSVDAEVWDTGPLWMVGGYSEVKPELFGFNSPAILVTIDGLELCASQHLGGSCNIWARQMSAGDVVSFDTMLGGDLDYFYHGMHGVSGSKSDYSILIPYPETIYLGFTTDSGTSENYKVYGWVELGMGADGPVVKSSAWDVDGGAMYVGGGAVPEPTAAMLLLFGVAGLALRRRCQHG